MLVGVDAFAMEGHLRPGAVLLIEATLIRSYGRMLRFEALASAEPDFRARAQLTIRESPP
jgi:hypothetical protein